MNNVRTAIRLACMFWVAALAMPAMPLRAQDAAVPDSPSVVKGVLFYSPTCPHCREVMVERLPPIMARYGDRLRIVAVSTGTDTGVQLYRAMAVYFGLTRERAGVPALVVGSTVLVGSYEIPTLLPGIVDRGLAEGGIDWPPVPVIREALIASGVDAQQPAAQQPAAQQPAAEAQEPAPDRPPVADSAADLDSATAAEATPATAPPPSPDVAPVPADSSPAQTAAGSRASPAPSPPTPGTPAPGTPPPNSPEPGTPAPDAAASAPVPVGSVEASHDMPSLDLSPWERFGLDPTGNSASVVMLLVLAGALYLGGRRPARGRNRRPLWPRWSVPVLAIIGLGIAVYLAFVEVTDTRAVCGPVGDCNTVQQSEYARLFGVIPVGLLGVLAYLALLVLWTLSALAPATPRRRLQLGIWALTFLGTMFSLYLTFLEPFVIGATCMWCLSSALVMALLLLAVSSAPASGPSLAVDRRKQRSP